MNRAILCLRRFLALSTLVGVASCSGGTDESREGLFHWAISTAVEIDAPAARIWNVLVDLPTQSGIPSSWRPRGRWRWERRCRSAWLCRAASP